MKSYENKPEEEMLSTDSPAVEEISSGDDEAVATTPAVPQEGSDTAADEQDSVFPLDEVSQRRFFPPSREQLWTAIAFGGVILLAAILRFWGLGDKPLHHDESLHGYFSLITLHNNFQNWGLCFSNPGSCYHYDPLLHGPFQFHIIAIVYGVSQLLGAPDHGVNTTTVRIAAALFGTALVGLPYFIRDYLGKVGAWLACFLLAVSPGMVYYSRFSREDIYFAFFTLLLVVAGARYIRDRKVHWIIIAALAFTLAYATKEATFLLAGIFGCFFGVLLVWEIFSHWALPLEKIDEAKRRFLPSTWAPIALLIYFAILGVIAKWFFGKIKELALWITDASKPANVRIADAYVAQLKANTQFAIPWLGIALAVVVIIILLREQYGKERPEGRRGLARFVDPQKQPLLDTLVTLPWMHWFFAIVLGWFVFLLLFTSFFTYMPNGIGDGIWQGLYYWLTQQPVARGGQPWYYYFLLIPLYEQIGVVFGLVGVVYCLLRPSRLRLFLVFWFIGSVAIYSWAGEKMPWLMIHINIPMLLLAALALQPAVLKVIEAVKHRFSHAEAVKQVDEKQQTEQQTIDGYTPVPISSTRVPRPALALGGSITVVVLAILTLLTTLQNMYQVNFVHYADAPHEMMIYVQTTKDIDTVMGKIAELDNKLYGGQKKIPIGLTDEMTWPYAWYVHDYTNVCFKYPSCATPVNEIPVVIGAAENVSNLQTKLPNYTSHQYKLRSQWDQGYMAPPCQKSAMNDCSAPQPYTGVGPWLWLSYGDNPPKDAKFDFGRAVNNVWQWWGNRKAFGDTNGSYDMWLYIRNDVIQHSGVKP